MKARESTTHVGDSIVTTKIQSMAEVIANIPSEVHAMYLTDGWGPVPTDNIPTALRWSMPHSSVLSTLNVFQLHLLTTYMEVLPFCCETRNL